MSKLFTFVAGLSIGSIFSVTVYKNYCIEPQYTEIIHEKTGLNSAKSILKYGFPGPISDLIYREAYVTSYNRQTRNPNWAAEIISTENAHPDRSKSHFKEDKSVPTKFRVKLSDYLKSGFDRGHLVPAADVKQSQEALDETFYLTNMSPQAIAFNRGYWAYFEAFCRSLSSKFDDVHVITGPLFLPKVKDGKKMVEYQVIGDSDVAVPTHFFKVILGVENGSFYLSSFVLPNQSIDSNEPLTNFIVPLDSIERASGLEFFQDIKRKLDLCSRVECKVKEIQFKE
ncbi:nuclease [Boothiomyces sp. JEL0866]|nr:nuclease [Boothiomyces sp. JEL0866]